MNKTFPPRELSYLEPGLLPRSGIGSSGKISAAFEPGTLPAAESATTVPPRRATRVFVPRADQINPSAMVGSGCSTG